MTNVNWTSRTEFYVAAIAICTALTYIPVIFPISLVRLVFYGVIAYAVYCKSKNSGKGWIMSLPICAAVVDVTPILSLIPFVPTVLNIAGIIMSFALTAPHAINQGHTKHSEQVDENIAA